MTHKIYRRLDVVKKNRCADVFFETGNLEKNKNDQCEEKENYHG